MLGRIFYFHSITKLCTLKYDSYIIITHSPIFKNMNQSFVYFETSKPVIDMKQNKRKFLVTLLLVVLGTVGILSFNTIQQPQPRKLQNIKALPADWTYQQVDHLMDEYKVDLGVNCRYCHAADKNNPRRTDAASDDNPKKDIARNMIRMTMEMNQKYIATIAHSDTSKVQLITCNTCHRGAAKPFGPIVAQQGPPQGPPPQGPPPAQKGK